MDGILLEIMHLARPVCSRFEFYHRHCDKTADAELPMSRARCSKGSAFCKSTRCSDIVHCSRFNITSSKEALQNSLPNQTQQRKNEICCAVGALSSPVQKFRSQYLPTAGLQRDTEFSLQLSPYPKPRPQCPLSVGWQRWFLLQIRKRTVNISYFSKTSPHPIVVHTK
jgi:hypothetical protein